MPKISLKLACPRCGFPANASVEEKSPKFILFLCPKCHSNVVYYDHKLDIISDRLLSKLIEKDKLKQCGVLDIDTLSKPDNFIDSDAIVNLKIALQTSRDVNDFLRKI